MRKTPLFFLFAWMPICGAGVMVEGHQSGNSFAGGLLSSVQDASKNTALGDIPSYVTDSPHEAGLDDGGVANAAAQAAHTVDAATFVGQSSKERQTFTLDPDTDPMFVNANKAIADPEKTIDVMTMEENGGEFEEDEIKECCSGGEEYTQTCQQVREVVLEITPEIKKVQTYCVGHPSDSISEARRYDLDQLAWCGGCATRVVITQHRNVEIIKDEWVDGCVVLESLSDQGYCRYESMVDSGPETRTIIGKAINPAPDGPETEQEDITRESWLKVYKYVCSKHVENTCKPLLAQGCIQVSSECAEKIDGVCVKWKQILKCPSKKRKSKTYRVSGQSPFCFTGDCVNADWEANGELAEALSYLTILKEAQTDIRANVGIFKGQDRQCSKNCISFKDCCTTGKGWGVSLGLSNCSGEEKELAQWRGKKRCTLIGTYCAEKLKPSNICIRKKTSFCCFGTKLARLINTQGRQQLGISWGEVKNPDCRGLTPEELSRLDFSTMDLSELYEDVYTKFNPPTQDHMAKGLELERIRENMKHLAKHKTDNLGLKKEQDVQLIKEYQVKRAELEQTYALETKALHEEFQGSLNPKTTLHYRRADNPDGGGFYTGNAQMTPECLNKYTRLTPQEVITQGDKDLAITDYREIEPKTDMQARWSGNYAAAASWRAANLKIVHGKIREFKASAENAVGAVQRLEQEKLEKLSALENMVSGVDPELLKAEGGK